LKCLNAAAILAAQPPDLITFGGTLTHQFYSDPVYRLQVLLLDRFDRNKTLTLPTHCFANRFSIVRIVLVAFHVRLDGPTVRQIDVLADLALVEAVRAEIGQLPTYGYRRAGALVNRQCMAAGLALLNHKRFYRVMKTYRLLLPKAPKRVVSARVHDGVVAVQESNRR